MTLILWTNTKTFGFLFPLDARYADIGVAQTSLESTAGGLARGGIWRRVEVHKRRDKDGPRHSGVFWSDCRQQGRQNGQNSSRSFKCCCSDASSILLNPQHPHRSMKDWSMSYRQIEETMKKNGAANDCVTGERECIFLLNITSNKHWDKCSWILCLTEKQEVEDQDPGLTVS